MHAFTAARVRMHALFLSSLAAICNAQKMSTSNHDSPLRRVIKIRKKYFVHYINFGKSKFQEKQFRDNDFLESIKL